MHLSLAIEYFINSQAHLYFYLVYGITTTAAHKKNTCDPAKPFFPACANHTKPPHTAASQRDFFRQATFNIHRTSPHMQNRFAYILYCNIFVHFMHVGVYFFYDFNHSDASAYTHIHPPASTNKLRACPKGARRGLLFLKKLIAMAEIPKKGGRYG